MNICAVALILLLDASGSVSNREFQLQQRGIAESFRTPGLQTIIQNQPGGIAVKVIEWGSFPRISIPWQMIHNVEDANQFADRIENNLRVMAGSTSMSVAIQRSIEEFETVPCQPEQRIIDISGDGPDNMGDDPSEQRNRAIQESITINALTILNDEHPDLEQYFRENVITPDGFVIIANGYSDFGRAIRRKLILEITQNNR